MSLTPEWRHRVQQWRDALRTACYEPLLDVPLRGFVTRDQLAPAAAARGPFRAMPPGTPWGAQWEYGWFRGTVRVPAAARGGRLVLHANTGAESRVLVNGREAAARDHQHPHLLLAERAAPGRAYAILIESYAGHGATPCGGGPVPHGVSTVPEPPARQQTVGRTTAGLWHEEVFQAWLDVESLLQLRDKLDARSLRVARIDEALRAFTLAVDPELPPAELRASVARGRAALAPALACRNGSTAPTLYGVGHAHIDVAWLWPLAETERKCARTFSTQLALMEQYPEYKFLQSQAHLYTMTKRLYPELYRRIQAAARRGQWLPEGGMWVEADTNLTGGESLIRQFLYGKRFFREEFGVDCRMLWLPDVFGYSGALPQILKGCGVPYFSTCKIFWTYNGGDPFPYNTFWWEGIDGTRVLSHLFTDYNSKTDPATLAQRWEECVQKDGLDARLLPFGWGDGGGGPTREHLEFLRRARDLEGLPRTRIASPLEFFRAEERRKADLPVYVGELYFQAHRGTYTSQARTKKGNRQGEFALREAELWSAAAAALGRARYPRAALEAAWRDLLLNQFHDIIPGSSIHRVYEEAEALHRRTIAAARRAAAHSARRLSGARGRGWTVLNSLGWSRTALVPLPAGTAGAAGPHGPLPVQTIEGRAYAETTVPPCGWTRVRPAPVGRPVEGGARASDFRLENECLLADFNAQGEIVRCVDKATGYEFAAGPLNSFRMYKDVPRWFEAWDIDSTYRRQPVELGGRVKVERVASGPLAAVLRIRRTLHNSPLVQEVWLRRGSRRLEFRTTIGWREKHKLLKVAFPLAVHAPAATHEIQFGHISRPNHRSRPFDADRFEVCNHKWTALIEPGRGAAVLNDCKYGVDVEGGTIGLTLLRAPQAPDMTADQGTQTFTYGLYLWNGPLLTSNLLQEAFELNVEPLVVPGAGGAAESLFELSAPNVILDTVKAAEDGSGDLILRLYEGLGTASRVILKTALPVRKAWVTDLLESSPEPLAVRGGQVELAFRAFEIKTLRLHAAAVPPRRRPA